MLCGLSDHLLLCVLVGIYFQSLHWDLIGPGNPDPSIMGKFLNYFTDAFLLSSSVLSVNYVSWALGLLVHMFICKQFIKLYPTLLLPFYFPDLSFSISHAGSTSSAQSLAGEPRADSWAPFCSLLPIFSLGELIQALNTNHSFAALTLLSEISLPSRCFHLD